MATYTPVAYTTAASNTQIDFDVTFTFLRTTDVVVSVIDPSGNVLVDGSDYDAELQALNNGTFDMRVVAAGTLNTTQTPLAANHVISLKRNTDISQLATVFQDGASFKAADINALITQLFNKIQEVEVSSGEGIGLTDDLVAFDAENKPLRNLGTPTADNDAVRKIDLDSGIGPAITTVAGIASDVSAVAADNTDIGLVAADLSGSDTIGTVAGISSAVSSVAGISSAVTGVNTISANVTTVANDEADIGTVAADLSGSDTIGTVATNIANVNALAPQASNIGTLTQSANLTALQNAQANAQAAQAALAAFENKYHGTHTNVAGNDAEVLADIAGDSALALEEGDLYFDSTNDRLRVYDGSAWGNAASVNVINATTLAAVGDVAAYSNIAQNDFIVRGATDWENADPTAARTALGLGTAATTDASAYATSTQGGLADTALQPGDVVNNLTTGGAQVPLSAQRGVALKGLVDANATAIAGKQATLTTTNDATGNISVHSLTTQVGNHGSGTTAVDVRKANVQFSTTDLTAEPGASLVNMVGAALTLTLPSTLSAGDIITVYSNPGTTGPVKIIQGSGGPNMRLDGETGNVSNPTTTGVSVGDGSLAVITMVGNTLAIISGSDLT